MKWEFTNDWNADSRVRTFFWMSENYHRWQELRFTVEPEAAEAIECALNSLDASGTAIDLMPTSAKNVCVIGYFIKLPDDEIIQDEIHNALATYGLDENTILSIEKNEIGNADWLAEWKKHWRPTSVGSFVIAAPWHDVDEPERNVIRIEPNMAFGTGTHETTQLCLKAIDELYEPGDSFLDVGTGTGILAIAAALKGRNTSVSKFALDDESSKLSIEGFDTDADAIEIARENSGTNRVGSEIQFHVGSIDKNIPAFNFVCANLTLDVILPLLPLLLSKARSYLILSGILKTQEPDIIQELANSGCREFTIETAGEWIAVIIQSTDQK